MHGLAQRLTGSPQGCLDLAQFGAEVSDRFDRPGAFRHLAGLIEALV
jgi:hypothetical protein